LIETLRFFLLGGGKKIAFVMAHLRRWKKESVFFKRAKKLFDAQIIHPEPPSNGSRIGVVVYLYIHREKIVSKRATIVNQGLMLVVCHSMNPVVVYNNGFLPSIKVM
ncbi:MAG: hypothetical protein Q8842_01810, partial [Candidatus Phytoplasma australasiaticum]|nr:hypothetical protein [Candidatus Phytoplasma australasiaticum]